MTAASPTASGSPWFVTRGEDLGRCPRVFCFPHAGGNARSFLAWQPGLGGQAEIVGVVTPGRGHRASESRPATIDELADGAAAAIAAADDERPAYLFGHSLGALVAFEVARRLRELPSLRHLVASGCAAPSLLPSERVVRAAALEGRAFAEAIGFFGGLPPEIVAAEELHEVLLPGLQADFRLVARYRYHPAPPLAVGVSLINGASDAHISAARLEPWRRECSAEPARHWADGGHFYFEPQPRAIVDLLASLLPGAHGAASDLRVELI